jgi:hypothetical protein
LGSSDSSALPAIWALLTTFDGESQTVDPLDR